MRFFTKILFCCALTPSVVMANPFRFGNCQRTEEESENQSLVDVNSCTRLNIGSEISASNDVDSPARNRVLQAHGYTALHINPWLSGHARGKFVHTTELSSEAGDTYDNATAEELLGQIGNPGLHRIYIEAGKAALPFGIDDTHLWEGLWTVKSHDFWPDPRPVALVNWDNRTNFMINTGVSRRSENAEDAAFALRLSGDISPLNGTRFVTSFMGSEDGPRRVGFAMFNRTIKGDTTSFEWIRLRATPTGASTLDRSITRLAHRTEMIDSGRWSIEYDDESNAVRIPAVKYEYYFFEQLFLHFGVGYLKSEQDGLNSSWLVSLGIGGTT